MMNYLRKKMKLIMISIAVIFAATMFYGIGTVGLGSFGGGKAKNTGLAKVNGQEIDPFRFGQTVNRLAAQAKGDLDPMSLLMVQSMALSEVIDFTLLAQDAKKQFGASGDEVNQAVNDIMKANKIPDRKTFEQVLKQQGFSLDNLKRMIVDEIVVQRMTQKIKTEVAVTPDDLREISASHILIRTSDKDPGNRKDEAKKLAEAVLKLAKSGQDFASLAAKYSQDPGTAGAGGALPFFRKGMMVKEFDEAAFALKPGEISNIIKTDYGYHIIKMNESRLRKDSNKDKLLEEKRTSVFNLKLLELRKKAKIEIENHLLGAFDSRMKGDLDAASAEFKKAIEAQPESAYPHLFFADMLSKAGKQAQALEEYSKASNIAGADPYAHVYIGRAFLGAAQTTQGATSEGYNSSARSEFEKASILAGEDLKIRKDLAKFFKQMDLNKLYSEEQSKIDKLEAKQKFEESIRKEAGSLEAR